MDNEILEFLGQLVDRLDNASAAADLPFPPEIHRAGLLGTVNSVRDELKTYLISNNFNPWSYE